MNINFNNASLLISAGNVSQFPKLVIPQVAFSGRSNVGKSSLINCLLNRNNFARVSSSPGKTVTINYYNIDKKLMLVDLPGYGFARSSFSDKERWSKLTDSYFTNNESIDLLRGVIQLVDGNVGPTKDDLAMISFLEETDIPYAVVYTKVDKMKATDRKNLEAAVPQFETSAFEVLCSSKSKQGRDNVWNIINSFCDF